MTGLAIMARRPRAYETPVAGEAPRVLVCRVNWTYYLDMRKCKWCKQINHQYFRTGPQRTECRRAIVNIVFEQ